MQTETSSLLMNAFGYSSHFYEDDLTPHTDILQNNVLQISNRNDRS